MLSESIKLDENVFLHNEVAFKSGPDVIKNLCSAEISNAHEYKNIKKFSFSPAQISLNCYFSCS